MNYKLEYITKLFQRTSRKAIEHYCLTRLWHRLDNDEIKFVPQQYIDRHIDKYALTDVYLPQFKIHVEVNEPEHYSSPERINADEERKQQVEINKGHTLYVIDCRQSLSEIHKQIENIAQIINDAVIQQKNIGAFKPWQPDKEGNPDFWKFKELIKESDEISFSNIEDICKLFDADFNKTKRGYLRRGSISHPKNNNYLIWWPSKSNRQGWINTLRENEDEIVETHSESERRIDHFNAHLNSTEKRIVLYHYKDILGLTSYRFKGVYVFDNLKSKPDLGIVWKRISKTINFNLN